MPLTSVYLVMPLRKRLDGGGLDVLGRIEIRLTGGKIDDIDAFGAKFSRLGGDRQSYRGFDQFGSFSQLGSCG